MSELNDNTQDTPVVTNTSENPVPEVITEPVTENGPEITTNGITDTVSGVEVVKKKRKGLKIAAIVACAVGVLVGGSFATYALVPQVKNFVKLNLNSPEKYYAWVEKENNKEFAKIFEEGNESASANVDISFDLNKESLSSLVGSSLDETLGFTLPSKYEINQKTAIIDGCTTVNQKISIDSNELLNCNGYSKDNTYYYQFPELSSSYISVDLNELLSMMMQDVDAEDEQVANIMSEIMSMSASGDEIISNEDLKKLYERYSTILINNVKTVDRSKNVTCEAGGVSCKLTKLSAHIDQGTLYAFAKDALKELENDEIVIKLVTENFGITEEEYTSKMSEVNKMLEKSNFSGGDDIIIMNVFVDNKGNVVGRTFDLIEDEETIATLGYNFTASGSDCGMSFFVEADDERYFIDGNFKKSSGKYTGTINVSDKFDIDVTDFRADEFMEGDLTLKLSDLGIDDVKVSFSTQDEKQLINADLNIQGQNLGSISISADSKTPDSMVVFNDQATVYDMDNIDEYVNSINDSTLGKNVCKILGLDESYADTFMQGFVQGFSQGLNGSFLEDDDYLTDVDQIDDYYDINSDPYANSTIEYDLSRVKIQIDGKDVTFPAKLDNVMKLIDFDEEKIEANDYSYGFNEDYTISASIYNNSDKAAAPKDCEISSLSISEGAPVSISIDGIKINDDIKKLSDKYGCKIDNTESGFIEIADKENYNNITFYYMDSKIYEISVSFY